MGGCGVTTPSFHMMAILRGLLKEGGWKEGFQGRGIKAGSVSQGLESMIVFMKRLRPERVVDRGPMTAGIASAPAAVEHHPSVGMRKAVGLRP